jgi:hypothetical protein
MHKNNLLHRMVATTSALLTLLCATPAFATPARLALNSDDTNLMPAFILGGIGLVVLVTAIVLKLRSSKGDTPDDDNPNGNGGTRHAGSSSTTQGKHSSNPGRHSR